MQRSHFPRTPNRKTPAATPSWRPHLITTPHQALPAAHCVRATNYFPALRGRLRWIVWNRGFLTRSVLRLALCVLALAVLGLAPGLVVALLIGFAQVALDGHASPPRRPLLHAV